ncbi:glutathione peroxidase [Poseidonibacter lekithochrous]|nr:glutathione peroxidase [Poseidonibacter lekithochrous]
MFYKILLIFILSISTMFAKEESMSVYDYKVKNIEGQEISLSKYEGKVLLIVNVASKCGFTSQYEGLEKLFQDYKDEEFMILGFPSNQFGSQEPGSNKEIQEFCRLTYGVDFDMFAKVDVNGENEIPLYTYLKKEASGIFGTTGIKWNFTKFLIDSKGKVIERYGSSTKPVEIEPEIKKLLGK